MKLISIKKAAEIIGVTQKTLRDWEKTNKIQVYRLPSGHRRYDEEYINNLCKGKNIKEGE